MMEVGPVVEKNLAFLRLSASCDRKQLAALLETASNSQLHAVCEVILNCLNGNIGTRPAKRSDILETLADSTVNLSVKKKILQQSTVYRGVIQRLLKSL